MVYMVGMGPAGVLKWHCLSDMLIIGESSVLSPGTSMGELVPYVAFWYICIGHP